MIVAGGTGKRMGTDIPKQFIELAGKPVLMHTIERFISFEKSIKIILVLPAVHFMVWEKLKKKYSFKVPHRIAEGGSTRFMSVKNGLELVPAKGLVAIHDGVRPLVSKDTIKRCFEAAQVFGNAVPVISSTDSLRLLTDSGSEPLNRQQIILVQTPQVFRANLIKNAFLQDYGNDFTDDATVLEKTGVKIHLVEGNRENIKITNPEDLLVASALISLMT